MKSGLKTLNTTRQNSSRAAIFVSTARPINTANPRPTVNSARLVSNVFNRAHSHDRRPFNKFTTNKNYNFNEKVNTIRGNVATVGPKAVVSNNKGNEANAVKASTCWVWRPKQKNLDYVFRHNGASMNFKRFDYIDAQGRSKVIDSWNASRPHDRNKTYLTNYVRKLIVEFGVAIEVIPKRGKITMKGRKPALSFMRPFGCPVTILNTIDHLGTKACDDAGKARVETIPGKDYILLPLWPQDPQFSYSSKDFPNVGFKPSGEEEKNDAEDLENKYSEVQDNAVDEDIVYGCADDLNILDLEEIDRFSDAEDDGVETGMTNLDTHIHVSPIPTTRIHKDHPYSKGPIIKTFRIVCLHVSYHKQSPRRNKKDERGIVIRNKARLVAQGHTQEEGFDYDEVFALVARIEAIRLFLAYASYKDFVMYQMDVKSAFLYGKIEEEVYVCQPPGFEDRDFPDRVYKVEKALYGLHQAPRAWYETFSTYLLENGFQVNPKVSHLHDVKRIFRYLKGQPKLGLWYPKDSPFDLVVYTDSDYAGASLDRKFTIGGCQFLGYRLISWQCKKQIMVANSTTEAEYIAASNCYGQVLWIQNKFLDYRYNFMQTKIHIDNESTICIVKNPVFN
ncbi:putative reverse transcriptase, RNA-dependent DNA polymerase [Tanacetum coccineum]